MSVPVSVPVRGVSSVPDPVSPVVAVGASLTAATVIVTVMGVEVAVPSVTV